MIRAPFELPPRPRLKGRAGELATLAAALARGETPRLALVGGGGSGKSVLAAALAHQIRARYRGGAAWLRVGAWDHRTLLQMLALHLGAPREPLVESVRAALAADGPRVVVLDNHENDRALARFLELLADAPVTWIITARRCLLTGVAIFPVIAPLVQSRRAAFPRVAALTSLLRWNPLALDIADALVADRAVSVDDLRLWLLDRGVTQVRVMAHEDDVVEVELLCEWAWMRLPAGARRLLAVLAHCPGDHMDARSLAALGRATGAHGYDDLDHLRRWRLVQEPTAGRFALHAVVRYALAGKASVPAERYFLHYLRLLEREPARLGLELSHFFAAMDHAQATSSLARILRVEALLSP
jgi:hypothetical protein